MIDEMLLRKLRNVRHIALIGFMGTGKSAVSSELAVHLGRKKAECDALIEEHAGMSIKEIFATYGETIFRDMETAVLARFTLEPDMVLSCGGGAVLRPENVHLLRDSGIVVLLTAQPETILQRVKSDASRPLLAGRNTLEGITSLLEMRRPYYEQAADLIVETDGKNVDAICPEILRKLTEMVC